MAILMNVAVLCLLLSTAASHPGRYSIEETIPAGTRVGITSPLGSNGERVLVKTVAGVREAGPSDVASSITNSEKTDAVEKPQETVPAVVIISEVPSSDVAEAGAQQQEDKKPVVVVDAPQERSAPIVVEEPVKQAEPRRAKVVLAGSAPGEIIFDQAGPGETVKITGQVSNLTANGKHGFHVHVYGDVGSNCGAAAGHFNPGQAKHGAPDADVRHVGDLGNILTDENGVANIAMEDHLISLFDGPNNILGRGIVIHAGEDDLGLAGDDGSMATGNAGARLSCGVIAAIAPVKKV